MDIDNDVTTCECGCTLRKDKLSQHKKSPCHKKLMEEKNKLKCNLTDEELDVFFVQIIKDYGIYYREISKKILLLYYI